jgi:exonuclease SbcC
MNPYRIRARNYRSYETLDLDLPTGCTALIGPNGAGKSTILNAIDFALYASGRELARAHSRDTLEPLEIELRFEHAGSDLLVRRAYDPAGRGSSTLDVLVDGEPSVMETMRETQAALEALLGFTRRTFRASSFLAQGDSAVFTEADPAARKAILAELLGLEAYAALRDRAAEQGRELGKVIARRQVELEQLQSQAAKVPDAEAWMAEARTRLEALEADLVEAQKAEDARRAYHDAARETTLAAARLSDADKAVATAEAQLAVAMREAATLETLRARASELEPLAAGLEPARAAAAERKQHAAEFAGLERRLADHKHDAMTLTARISAGNKEHAKLTAAIERINVAQECPTCGQPVADDAAAKAVEQTAARLEALEAALVADSEALDESDRAVAAIGDQAEALRRALTASEAAADPAPLEAAAAELRRLEGRLEATDAEARVTTLAEVLAEADALRNASREALETARAAAGDPPPAPRLNIDEVRRSRDALAQQVAVGGARLEDFHAAAESAQNLHEVIVSEARQEHTLAKLTEAFGRDGIPAMIIEMAAIPSIESEANLILSELGTTFRVELRTTRELKSGKTADALDVVILTDTGESLYEDFSGGEKTRVNLALRIGLARLLATRRGRSVAVLCVDEPEFLDDEGTDALSATLIRLAQSAFDRVLLVSHQPSLKDAFDQTITITKDSGSSRVAAEVPA